jgi:hypothetical protein
MILEESLGGQQQMPSKMRYTSKSIQALGCPGSLLTNQHSSCSASAVQLSPHKGLNVEGSGRKGSYVKKVFNT